MGSREGRGEDRDGGEGERKTREIKRVMVSREIESESRLISYHDKMTDPVTYSYLWSNLNTHTQQTNTRAHACSCEQHNLIQVHATRYGVGESRKKRKRVKSDTLIGCLFCLCFFLPLPDPVFTARERGGWLESRSYRREVYWPPTGH